MIRVSYEIDPIEMTEVTATFLELKPFTRFCILTINIGVLLILTVMGLKIWLGQLQYYEVGVMALCLFWIFFRKKFNRWLFKRRLKNQNIINQQVEMTFSPNGIIWGGPKLKEGHIQWRSIKKCHEIKNGYILATSSTRFLWLPFHGFEAPERINNLKNLFKQKGIIIESCKTYTHNR
ncbi:MAG: YcxB family protein [Gammaproteobacteria bacterium]